MRIKVLNVGDTLRCTKCGHSRLVSQHWVEEVCRKSFATRSPAVLRTSDVTRFKCSSCGEKKLEVVTLVVPTAVEVTPADIKGRQLAVTVIEQASQLEREAMLNWATQLVEIRNSHLTSAEKAKAAISATIESKAIYPFIKTLGREIKRIGWVERSLPARIGLSAAAFAAVLLSGKGAGIAALGGAIGVPLWVVFGAGGAFAGVIIEELGRQRDRKPPQSEPRIIDGEVLEEEPVARRKKAMIAPNRTNDSGARKSRTGPLL